MKISKDTQICCSFSKNPGTFGMSFHNRIAEERGINLIYKSFEIHHIGKAMEAMRTLKFRGAAISSPYKIEAFHLADECGDSDTLIIGATNTVINENGKLVAYNTDWIAARNMLLPYVSHNKQLFILGYGGYAKSVQWAADTLNMTSKTTIITRKEWNEIEKIRDSIVFNCTPVADIAVNETNIFVDCIVGTSTGNQLAFWQAEAQFELFIKKDTL